MRAFTLRLIFFINLILVSAAASAEFMTSISMQATQLEITSHSDFDSSNYFQSSSDQATDIGGEVAVGYRYQLNDIYDIDLDIFGQLINTQTDVPVIAGDNPFGVAGGEAEMDWLWGVRVRPGYRVTDTTRFFIDLGLVWGHFEAEFPQQAIDATNVDANKDRTLGGFRYGMGIERNFTDFFSVGVDYTITNFESTNVDDISLSDDPTANNRTHYTPSLYTLGLNFKVLFGGEWF